MRFASSIVSCGRVQTYTLVHNAITPRVQTVEAYLTWRQAFIMSVTSFHGRGFFPSEITGSLGHGMWAAGEAFIGLLITLRHDFRDTSVLSSLARKWASNSQVHACNAYLGQRNLANEDRTDTSPIIWRGVFSLKQHSLPRSSSVSFDSTRTV